MGCVEEIGILARVHGVAGVNVGRYLYLFAWRPRHLERNGGCPCHGDHLVLGYEPMGTLDPVGRRISCTNEEQLQAVDSAGLIDPLALSSRPSSCFPEPGRFPVREKMPPFVDGSFDHAGPTVTRRQRP